MNLFKNKTFLVIIKVIAAAFFVIGLDFVIPFNTAGGLNYLRDNGKWLLFIIAAINVFVGGGISGGFLSNNVKAGFRQWFMPIQVKGELNATYAFGGLIAVINVLFILLINP
jgi:hypothetical protein